MAPLNQVTYCHFVYTLEHDIDQDTGGDRWRIIARRVGSPELPDRLLKVFSNERDALEQMRDISLAVEHTHRLGVQNTLAEPYYTYDVEGFRQLVEEADDVNVKISCRDATCLHLVSWSNSDDAPDLIRLLLDRGADVNARDWNGSTPLMWCSFWCSSATSASLLIAAGADIHARNNDGNTPLHFCENVDIAALLLESGADINARNSQDLTAEDLALQGSDYEGAPKAEVHQFLRSMRIRQGLATVAQQTTGTVQRTAADQRRSL